MYFSRIKQIASLVTLSLTLLLPTQASACLTCEAGWCVGSDVGYRQCSHVVITNNEGEVVFAYCVATGWCTGSGGNCPPGEYCPNLTSSNPEIGKNVPAKQSKAVCSGGKPPHFKSLLSKV
jgi:hypothetical protein